MNEIDNFLRDLEAGLFLQTRAPLTVTENTSAGSQPLAGLLTIAIEGHQLRPAQALIGRDFVAWADAQALHIVPGRHASIRVEKSLNSEADSATSYVIQQKLTFSKYLGNLCGHLVQVKIKREATNHEGVLLGVRGSFALIDSVSSTNLVELTKLLRVRLPVNNFSEIVNHDFK